MTVVVNGRFLGARTTGVQRTARGLLEAARTEGLDFTVMAPSGVEDRLVDRTTPALRGRFAGNVWEQVVLPIAARRRAVLSLANTAPVALRRAAVVVHDLATLVEPRWFRRDMLLYGKISLAAARRASVVFAVSRQVAGELIEAGVPGERTHLLRWALDPAFHPATAEEVTAARRRFGLERDYVLHVGWADPRKDATLLVAAHLAVVAGHPHDLVLVGSPHPNLAPVELPDQQSVRVLANVDDVELRALMTGAAAFAYPSQYEGFGLPPLEAMACGTPALVSDIPALRESAGEGATFLPSGNLEAWVEGIRQALARELRPAVVPAWSWADAVAQLSEGLDALA
jgi:glycosyltransferase involved in cell wall biosynthesis